MPASRRYFIRQGAAMAATATFLPAQSERLVAAPGKVDWFDKPMRWSQLVLVENDPGRYDPQFWLNYFRRLHSDAACLSAGGCVAYYPTRIPFHHRSKWMGDIDPFGVLVEGCRKMDMVVVARTDPHAIWEDAAKAHPEWIAVDAEGNKRRHWATPEMWVTCALGPYNFGFMTDVTREIVKMYQVDGIFTNRWSGSGMCYCDSCVKNFRQASGFDLPRTNDPQDPVRRTYILWHQDRLFELWRLWDKVIKEENKNACYIANAGGGALSNLDMKTIGELASTLFADRQARQGVTPPWAAGKNAKEYRATLGKKAIAGIASVGVEEHYRWKDSVQTPAEIEVWMRDGIAQGMRPWFIKFSGYLYDERWLDPVARLYEWHYRNERYLKNVEPVANVAMVYSQQSAWFYGGPNARRKIEDHTMGLYHALVEARIPFEMVHDRLLDPEHIDGYGLLLLPNIAALSDKQCAQLREYVKRGGSLLATYETSLYDEWGKPRSDFGLADLFGVSYTGKREGPMQNSYLRLEHRTKHPILRGLEDAPRIINGAYRLQVKATQPFPNPPVTLIPSYPDLPMENVFPRADHTGIPEVYLRQIGDGRVVFIPWDIDRIYWEVMAWDHGRLLANCVRWAMKDVTPVQVEGAGVVDVSVWRQQDSLTVHLVNLTNPMMMKGPYREHLPSPEQRVKVGVPAGRTPRTVQLLSTGANVPIRLAGGMLDVTVPPFLVHEVIAVDLAV